MTGSRNLFPRLAEIEHENDGDSDETENKCKPDAPVRRDAHSDAFYIALLILPDDKK
jgi:hypothetical protein